MQLVLEHAQIAMQPGVIVAAMFSVCVDHVVPAVWAGRSLGDQDDDLHDVAVCVISAMIAHLPMLLRRLTTEDERRAENHSTAQ